MSVSPLGGSFLCSQLTLYLSMPVADNATTFPTFTIQVNDVCRSELYDLTHSLTCGVLHLDRANLGFLQAD